MQGTPITETEANDLVARGDLVVGGGIQDELIIGIRSEDNIKNLVSIFHKYLNLYVLDPAGCPVMKDGKPSLNQDAIPGAWQVPVLLMENIDCPEPAFVKMDETVIDRKEYHLSTISNSTTEKLHSILKRTNLTYFKRVLSTNRLFAEFIEEQT